MKWLLNSYYGHELMPKAKGGASAAHVCLKINTYKSNLLSASAYPGLSHPFLGMGPGPLELGKIASF